MFTLSAANGSRINEYGYRTVPVRLFDRSFSWRFCLADVRRPLLGADFLRHHGLLVDVANERLVDPKCLASAQMRPSSTDVPQIGSLALESSPWAKLLARFPSLTTPVFNATPKHTVEHFIHTSSAPPTVRLRPLSPQHLQLAKAEFSKLVKLGICRRSSSRYRSNLVMVNKSDGSKRYCGDYTRLNAVTVPDAYPLPLLADFTANLAGCTVFSKVDLIRGYHQVPVAQKDIPKMAIVTPFGLFEYVRMPFGLRNAAQTFQRLMDEVCLDLDFAFAYLDDVLIASPDPSSHKVHVERLFERFADFGLAINPAKCEFGKQALDFLGYRVDRHGLRPLEHKVTTIREFPQPTTIVSLQRFLGMFNFYRRFVPDAARILAPLYDPLRGKTEIVTLGSNVYRRLCQPRLTKSKRRSRVRR